MADETTIQRMLDSVSDKDIALRRSKIQQLENILLECEQIEVPVREFWCGDVYAREITIPKNAVMTGKIHKFDHFDVMISGDMTVSSDDGSSKRIKGYNIWEAHAGKKRAGFAHEETIWITFHCAPDLEPKYMVPYLTVNNFQQLSEFYSLVNRENVKRDAIEDDRADYAQLLHESDFTQSYELARMTKVYDQVDIDYAKVARISQSDIHGLGMFALQTFDPGHVIGVARLKTKRTAFGRYVNHSKNPNCLYFFDGENIVIQAKRLIAPDDELTVDYRQAVQEAIKAQGVLG